MSGKILICALTGAVLACFGTVYGDQPATTAPATTTAPAATTKSAATTAPAANTKSATAPTSDYEKAAASAASQRRTSVTGVVTETAEAANKVADYGTGATPLRAKKQMESKLKNIQKNSNQRLEKELQ